MYQQRGELPNALIHYKRALTLAQHDPDLEHAVQTIEHVVSPPAPVKSDSPPLSIEDLFDFDTLLEQLGGRPQRGPEVSRPIDPAAFAPSVLDQVRLPADASDPLAVLERQLRENEERRVPEDPHAGEQRERRVIGELEDWLAAILVDRDHHRPSA